jgi:hypothetical protein
MSQGGDEFCHQTPYTVPASPSPHGVYIDMCIILVGDTITCISDHHAARRYYHVSAFAHTLISEYHQLSSYGYHPLYLPGQLIKLPFKRRADLDFWCIQDEKSSHT